ncbi:hypothetical protein LCGC14_3150140 [marine sediment metagenome]|uniref:Uncharacterized protein n=1 Tax=marine sediment metagenome TaxID=412755 RepID=A0A0F8VUF9_9ZZZZ
MIFGGCPYDGCDAPFGIPIQCTQFERHECETCGLVIWTKHSRINPWSMTEADFLEAYDVDPLAKTINKKAVR